MLSHVVLWPGTGNEWYGFGMNAYTLNYNVVGAGTHKFYCGTAVAASISSTTTTFNNAVTCGSNALTCGALTCTTGTLGGSAIVTLATLQSSVYLKQAVTMYPVYYNTGRGILLGCDSANNSYIDFHCVDAATTAQTDVRIQASGGSAGSNFTSALSFYGSNFYFNGGVNTSTNSITCGGLTINDTSYGNAKLLINIGSVNTAAFTSSQDYIYIGYGGYGGYGYTSKRQGYYFDDSKPKSPIQAIKNWFKGK